MTYNYGKLPKFCTSKNFSLCLTLNVSRKIIYIPTFCVENLQLGRYGVMLDIYWIIKICNLRHA